MPPNLTSLDPAQLDPAHLAMATALCDVMDRTAEQFGHHAAHFDGEVRPCPYHIVMAHLALEVLHRHSVVLANLPRGGIVQGSASGLTDFTFRATSP